MADPPPFRLDVFDGCGPLPKMSNKILSPRNFYRTTVGSGVVFSSCFRRPQT